mmetsp:Transcript_39956/g.55542  ORF Transcript_39956/g.55542 Transcript_39956/m.55542 type:complete len:159 (-) Transcript_39956:66-542(-)
MIICMRSIVNFFFVVTLVLVLGRKAVESIQLRGEDKEGTLSSQGARKLMTNHQLALYMMRHGAGWNYPSPPAPYPSSPAPPLLPPLPPPRPPPPFPPGFCNHTLDHNCLDVDGHWIRNVTRLNTEREQRLSLDKMFDAVTEKHEHAFKLKDYMKQFGM